VAYNKTAIASSYSIPSLSHAYQVLRYQYADDIARNPGTCAEELSYRSAGDDMPFIQIDLGTDHYITGLQLWMATGAQQFAIKAWVSSNLLHAASWTYADLSPSMPVAPCFTSGAYRTDAASGQVYMSETCSGFGRYITVQMQGYVSRWCPVQSYYCDDWWWCRYYGYCWRYTCVPAQRIMHHAFTC
jgi:hypothetical protein